MKGALAAVCGRLPSDLIAAGHGEQPLALQDAVPRLDGVAGAHGDGALS